MTPEDFQAGDGIEIDGFDRGVVLFRAVNPDRLVTYARDSKNKIWYVDEVDAGEVAMPETSKTDGLAPVPWMDLAEAVEDRTVFSEREAEVFVLLLAGLERREIAERLDISPNTVDDTRYRALERLSRAATTTETFGPSGIGPDGSNVLLGIFDDDTPWISTEE